MRFRGWRSVAKAHSAGSGINSEFDRSMAMLIREDDPTKWYGPDVETVVYTARLLQLQRRKLTKRLGLEPNAPWSEIIVRLEKYLPCRECGLVGTHKMSCVTGAEQWADEQEDDR